MTDQSEPHRPPKNLKDNLWTALIILGVLAVGLLCVNQYLEFRYKAQFLAGPCELCAETNPARSTCVKECFTGPTQTLTLPASLDDVRIPK